MENKKFKKLSIAAVAIRYMVNNSSTSIQLDNSR